MIHEDNGPVFPVVIFPENIRKIIDATHEESCFPVNYIAAALFFAASVAVGNYCTMEAFTKVLGESKRGIFVFVDELRGWISSFNKYNAGGGDREPAWRDQGWRRDLLPD